MVLQKMLFIPPGCSPQCVLLTSSGDIIFDANSTDSKCISHVGIKPVLESLGGTLYACLDYGLGTSEERALSAPLEHLISTLADLEDQPDASSAASEATTNEDANGARLAASSSSSSSLSASASASAQGVSRRLSTIDEAHETSQSAAPSPPPELTSRQNSRPAADGDEGIHDCYNPEPDADLVRSLLQICEAHFCGCGTEASSLCGDARCTSADEHYAAVCRRLHEHAARMLCFLTRVRESERALELLAASSDLYQVTGRRIDQLETAHQKSLARRWLALIGELDLANERVRLRPVRDGCSDRSAPRVALPPLERLLADVCARRFRLRPTATGAGALADGDSRSTDSGAAASADHGAHSDEEATQQAIGRKRCVGSCNDLLSLAIEPKSKVMREIMNKRHTLQPATARKLAERPARPISLRDRLLHDICTVEPQLKHVPQHERASPRRTLSTILAPSMVPGGHLLQPTPNRRQSYGLGVAGGSGAGKLAGKSAPKLSLVEFAELDVDGASNAARDQCSPPSELVWSSSARRSKRAARGLDAPDGKRESRRNRDGESRSPSASPVRSGDEDAVRDTDEGLFVSVRTRDRSDGSRLSARNEVRISKSSSPPIPPPASLETHLTLPAQLHSGRLAGLSQKSSSSGRASSSVVGKLPSAHRDATVRPHLNTGLTMRSSNGSSSMRSLSYANGATETEAGSADVNLAASMGSKRTIKAERNMFRFDDSDEDEGEAVAAANKSEATESSSKQNGTALNNGVDGGEHTNVPQSSSVANAKHLTKDSRRRSQSGEAREGVPAVLELTAADGSPRPVHRSTTSAVSYSSSKTASTSAQSSSNASNTRPNYLHTSPISASQSQSPQPQSQSPAPGSRSRIPVLMHTAILHSPQQENSSTTRIQNSASAMPAAGSASTSAPASATSSPLKQLPARALVLDPHSLGSSGGCGSTPSKQSMSPSNKKASPTQANSKAPSSKSSPNKSSAASTPTTVVQLDMPQDNAGQNGQQWEMMELTVAEIMRVRLTITDAELEAAALSREMLELIEQKRLCFVCRITRLGGWFGQRAVLCSICRKGVCSKCSKQLRVPGRIEFLFLPVLALAAQLDQEMLEIIFASTSKNDAHRLHPPSLDSSVSASASSASWLEQLFDDLLPASSTQGLSGSRQLSKSSGALHKPERSPPSSSSRALRSPSRGSRAAAAGAGAGTGTGGSREAESARRAQHSGQSQAHGHGHGLEVVDVCGGCVELMRHFTRQCYAHLGRSSQPSDASSGLQGCS